MLRDLISNDALTFLLFFSLLIILILKKIDVKKFEFLLSFKKRELISSLVIGERINFKFFDFLFKLLFISNFSIIYTFWKLNQFDLTTYFSVAKICTLFYLLKNFLEICIGWLFGFQKIIKVYLWSKLIFKNSLGILILIFNFIISYNSFFQQKFIYFFIILSITYLIVGYLIIFISFKNIIGKNWFYFILYLCTLEIIPYYYFAKSIV